MSSNDHVDARSASSSKNESLVITVDGSRDRSRDASDDDGYVALMDYHKLERAHASIVKRCDGLEDRVAALSQLNAKNYTAIDKIFGRINKLELARVTTDDTLRRIMRRNGPTPPKPVAIRRERSLSPRRDASPPRDRSRSRSRAVTPRRNAPVDAEGSKTPSSWVSMREARHLATPRGQVRAYSCNQHELCIVVNGVHGALTIGNGSARS